MSVKTFRRAGDGSMELVGGVFVGVVVKKREQVKWGCELLGLACRRDALKLFAFTTRGETRATHLHTNSTTPPQHSKNGNGRQTTNKWPQQHNHNPRIPPLSCRVSSAPRPDRAPQNLSSPPPHHPRLALTPPVLKTSLTPPATGSAFLELSAPSTLKLTASVYGPRPLPPTAVFSPHARIAAELKFAPFSTLGARRGYVRDALERDLSAQLQVALSRAIKTSAYPKSGIDVFVTVLDCEGAIDDDGLGAMQALAGAITCASAAVADAGIECVDLVSAGIAAVVEDAGGEGVITVLDPSPLDGYDIKAAALVAYMAGRDEVSLLWVRGEVEGNVFDGVVDSAVQVATGVRAVVNEAVKERVLLAVKAVTGDVDMSG